MLTFQAQVGARIKELREQKGVSQEALAAICNLHRTYVGLIERGKRNLSLATVEQVAIGLGVAPSELFTTTKLAPPNVVAPKVGKKGSPAPPTLSELAAEIATIRQILTEAKLINPKRYEDARRRHRRENASR